MSVYVEFQTIHSFFNDPFVVGMEWDFPFLPRIGETVNPWIWIKAKEIKMSDLENYLTEEGKKNLEKNSGDLEDWLYEVGLDGKHVKNIAYYRNVSHMPKIGNGDYYIVIYLGDPNEK